MADEYVTRLSATTGEEWREHRLYQVGTALRDLRPYLSSIAAIHDDRGRLYVNFDTPRPTVRDVQSVWRVWIDQNEAIVHLYAQGIPLLGADPAGPFVRTFTPSDEIDWPHVLEGLSFATDDIPLTFSPSWDPVIWYRPENATAVRKMIGKVKRRAARAGARDYGHPLARLSTLAALLEAGLSAMDHPSGGLLVEHRFVVAPQKMRWRYAGNGSWRDYANNEDLLTQLRATLARGGEWKNSYRPKLSKDMQKVLVAIAIDTDGGPADYAYEIAGVERMMKLGLVKPEMLTGSASPWGPTQPFTAWRITEYGRDWLVDAGHWCPRTNRDLTNFYSPEVYTKHYARSRRTYRVEQTTGDSTVYRLGTAPALQHPITDAVTHGNAGGASVVTFARFRKAL
ncbi:MAG: hypothetical protein KF899_04165 [Parvibaculum sp.]|nr:hypothetical protein [Parvibaculum sp.]